MFAYPDINPIALQIGPLAIRWYALAYLAGVVGGWWLVGKLNARLTPPLISKEGYDDIMAYAITGIILGGRLGYVFFYKPFYYYTHPQEALMIWHGGMSFHGGLLGMIAAMALFARRYKTSLMGIMDLLAVVTPIGLCFGRLANFINGELYGRVTGSKLGMIFPGGGPLPRYPSQLFEASLEGVLLFTVLVSIAHYTRALEIRGRMSGLFLIGYSITRSMCELFREPDAFIGFLPGGVTMGQVLCVPMLLLGIWLVLRRGPETQPL